MDSNLTVFANTSLLSLLIIGIPMLVTLGLFLVKKNMSENFAVYLYAFSSGLLIILSTLGLIGESNHGVSELMTHGGIYEELPLVNQTLIKVGIVGGGTIVGLIVAITIKISIFKYHRRKSNSFNGATLLEHNHSHHEDDHHVHNDQKCCVVNMEELIKKNGKLSSMVIISSHKFIDGISLGIFASEATGIFQFDNIWIILLFIIHDLPITVIIYFTQKVNKVSKPKILLYTLILNLITVPFIFIGGFAGHSLEHQPNLALVVPFIQAFAGGVLIFTTLMEIVPEFIHNHHLCTKHWYITVLWLSCGIVLSLIFTLIDMHAH